MNLVAHTLLGALLLTMTTTAQAIDMPPTDKAAHFAVSSLGVASTLRIAEYLNKDKTITPTARVTASLLWLAIGFAKEMQDARIKSNGFDTGDMAANLGGIVYGNVLVIDF